MVRKAIRFASFGGAVGLLLMALHGNAGAVEAVVPEIDPSTMASGVAILGGAALLLIERFRRG